MLIAHSYGSNVVVYFMKWVESKQGGNGGAKWVDNHVHSFVNVAGPLLYVNLYGWTIDPNAPPPNCHDTHIQRPTSSPRHTGA